MKISIHTIDTPEEYIAHISTTQMELKKIILQRLDVHSFEKIYYVFWTKKDMEIF